jgi:hypothetical protein
MLELVEFRLKSVLTTGASSGPSPQSTLFNLEAFYPIYLTDQASILDFGEFYEIYSPRDAPVFQRTSVHRSYL